MLYFRDAMLKAQVEIDSVVGLDRMPGFEDKDRLPYVCGLINETFRWRTSTLTGIPHAVTADNVYNGM
jgi:Cytochrome P450